ncbi:MAG: VOC family protein [Roseburia sp.]
MKEKYKITGIAHVGIPTNDIEMTKKFYQSLGFDVILETYNEKAKEKVVFLQCKNYCVETFENKQAVMVDGAYQHVALEVEDIEQMYVDICRAGYLMATDGIETLPFWKNGVKFFMVYGPNRERIEFCQKL